MPESLEELVKRILEHAHKHMTMALEIAQRNEWDTVDFLLSIAVNDIVTARSIINTKLQYLKKQ